MTTFAVILARAGSKGLPDKCVLPLCGRCVLSYTIEHAQQARHVDAVILSTDSAQAAAVAKADRVHVVDRPPELAADTAPVDAAVRHAVETYESGTGTFANAVVILYGNVPVRAAGVIDRCVEHLTGTGCDSVRTLAPVTKQHPDWIHRLDGDRMEQFRARSHHLAQCARAQLVELTGLEPIVPDSRDWYGSMAHVPLPQVDALRLQQALWNEYGIEVPVVDWGGRQYVRVSCHLYNTRQQIDKLAVALRKLLA